MSGTDPAAPGPTPRAGSLPFDEAIAFLRARLNVPTRTYTDLWQDQHAVGFMVAGAATADLVADLRAEVDRALAEGRSLDDFRRGFAAVAAKHGWSYNGGLGWRSRVVLETNLRSAYATGKWAQAQATKATRPYLRYSAVLDGRVRELHRRWHGTVLPIDDAWWKTHYPPNGWGCRCTVLTVSERDLERNGWRVGPAPTVATRDVVVNGVGRVTVPEGIDPGFGSNIGLAAARSGIARMTAAKLGRYPPDLAAVVHTAFPTETRRAIAEEFTGWAREVLDWKRPKGGDDIRVLGALPPSVVARLKTAPGLDDVGAIFVRANDLTHMRRSDKVTAGVAPTLADVMRLPDIVARPDAVLLERQTGEVQLIFTPSDPDEARRGRFVVLLKRDVAYRLGGVRGAAAMLRIGRTITLVPDAVLRNAGVYEVLNGAV